MFAGVVEVRSSVSLESLLPIRRQTSSTVAHNRSGLLAEHSPNQSWTTGSMHSNPEVTTRRLPTIPNSRPSRQSSVLESGESSVVDVMGRVKLDYSPESLSKVDGYKERLNTSSVEWWQLRMEDDPCVLAALIYDWMDELKVNFQGLFFRLQLPFLLLHLRLQLFQFVCLWLRFRQENK